MSRTLIIAGLLVAGVSGGALAQSTFSAWGHDFTISGYTPHQGQIAVAIDRKTGRKFNCLKLPDGRMVALVPFKSLKEMPEVADEDMIHT